MLILYFSFRATSIFDLELSCGQGLLEDGGEHFRVLLSKFHFGEERSNIWGYQNKRRLGHQYNASSRREKFGSRNIDEVKYISFMRKELGFLQENMDFKGNGIKFRTDWNSILEYFNV